MHAATGARVRPAAPADDDAIWAILEPAIRGGEVFALPRDLPRAEGLAWWRGGVLPEVFVAEADGRVVGTSFVRANQQGPGGHVANAGYATAPEARGHGVAATLCAHSLAHAAARGFRAMQFNYVVSSNTRAVALWERFGFAIVGRLPAAFAHPTLGDVDVYVMYRALTPAPSGR